MSHRSNPRPPPALHRRILADLEQRILSGRWPLGHRIPPEQALTAEYGCSRMTVNKVLTRLARAGMIERRRKAGSFVARSPSRAAMLEIQEVRAEVEALGLPYRYEISKRIRRRSLRSDCARLGLARPGPVLALVCRHFAAERPYCVEERLINLVAVPAAAAERFEASAPGTWLLGHVPWTTAEHRIRATGAGPVIATALALRKGTPCLVIERRTWLTTRPVTQVRLTYPGEGRELVARFSPSQG